MYCVQAFTTHVGNGDLLKEAGLKRHLRTYEMWRTGLSLVIDYWLLPECQKEQWHQEATFELPWHCPRPLRLKRATERKHWVTDQFLWGLLKYLSSWNSKGVLPLAEREKHEISNAGVRAENTRTKELQVTAPMRPPRYNRVMGEAATKTPNFLLAEELRTQSLEIQYIIINVKYLTPSRRSLRLCGLCASNLHN